METANNRSSVLADAVIGAVAGAAAVWVMDRVDWFNFLHVVDPEARRQTQAVRPGGMDPAHVAADKLAQAVGWELGPGITTLSERRSTTLSVSRLLFSTAFCATGFPP
jgi:hypothetical protein